MYYTIYYIQWYFVTYVTLQHPPKDLGDNGGRCGGGGLRRAALHLPCHHLHQLSMQLVQQVPHKLVSILLLVAPAMVAVGGGGQVNSCPYLSSPSGLDLD